MKTIKIDIDQEVHERTVNECPGNIALADFTSDMLNEGLNVCLGAMKEEAASKE